ncbi:MAG: hypothetical protein IPL47_01980 [Phyllobacteriaceae bacterium]|nr:hypothetical protein [Phyllobacteriaceae bacterium]
MAKATTEKSAPANAGAAKLEPGTKGASHATAEKHVKAFAKKLTGSQSISVEVIREGVKRVLNPKKPESVSIFDPLSKYAQGGGLAIIALINHINKASPFKETGLSLTPQDLPANPAVGDLMTAIIKDYEKRGWIVTH